MGWLVTRQAHALCKGQQLGEVSRTRRAYDTIPACRDIRKFGMVVMGGDDRQPAKIPDIIVPGFQPFLHLPKESFH